MKKLGLILAFIMLFSTFYALPSQADTAPTVTLNGAALHFDVQPVIVNGRLLVPLRGIFDALGASVAWDGATQTVTAVQGSTTIILTINSQVAYKNGVPVTLDVPPALVSGRTMVPLRFVAESMSCYVNFDPVANGVTIQSGQTTPTPALTNTQTPITNVTGRWQSGGGNIYALEQIGNHISGNGGSDDKQFIIEGTIIDNSVTLDYKFRDAISIHNEFKKYDGWQYRFAEEMQDSGGLHIKVVMDLQTDGMKMEGYQYPFCAYWENGELTHVYQGGSEGALQRFPLSPATLTRMGS